MNSFEKRATFALSLVSGIRMLGLFMLLPVLPICARLLPDASPLLIGLALGIYGFPQALLQIPAGYLSDHIGRKPVIIGGLILFAAGSLIAALFSNNIYGIIVGRFFQGSGAIASTTIALLTDLTQERYRTRAMAFFGMSIGCAFCLAMVVGPLLATQHGISFIFWLTFIFCFIAIGIICFMVPTPVTPTKHKTKSNVLKDITQILMQKNKCSLFAGIFILHFTLMGLFMSLPVLLQSRAGLPFKYHGWLYLGILIVSFIIMVPFIILSERKNRLAQCISGAIGMLLIAVIWLVATPFHFTSLITGALLYFVAFNFLEAALPSTLSKLSFATSKGVTMGIYSSCQFLGAGIGGILSGFIIQNLGYRMLLIICCLFIAFWWIITFLSQTKRTQ